MDICQGPNLDLDREVNPSFVCPNCSIPFKHKSSMIKHIDHNRCEALKVKEPEPASARKNKRSPRVQLRVDTEVSDLLNAIPSDYVRWRVSQLLGVAQVSCHPILFGYTSKGAMSKYCPTTDPTSVMVGVLTDAYTNFNISELVMPKHLVIVDEAGVETDVSKWLKPSNVGKARTNRPKLITSESSDTISYRLAKHPIVELNASMQNLSLDDPLNTSVSSFMPPYESSPLPGRTLAMESQDQGKYFLFTCIAACRNNGSAIINA